MGLTKKQEIFCQEVIKQDYASDAYKIAYSASKMSDNAIYVHCSKMMKNPKISLRIKELKKTLADKKLYTLEQSVKRDIKLIERYEAALDVLENDSATPKEIEVAERTIKFIGSHGYNSAQERLSKQHGFYEKDNDQKASQVKGITLNIRDYSEDGN